mmetsp:Transcript_17423/g.31526  ORF Transcript_17423/g.31526 Transcript_17423/m.31526 type:complete len:114 (+) Transcript_17423:1710-2051(+)
MMFYWDTSSIRFHPQSYFIYFSQPLQAEWIFDPSTGEIYSTVFDKFGGEVCLTTGWPCLQVGAFDTSATGETAKAAVILNEAGESANYVFKNKGKTLLTGSIPPHSIQTISFD